ncbi:MAG: hypothetical protein KAS48_03640 [Gammaproteobacteria bacterium]|nr:hypothetical protein [Gammaproteobacteria bacterium]MCK5092448.1 hypothetical protein [Gammaproteobacteria bacterium]
MAANLCLILVTVWGHLWNNNLIERGKFHDYLEELNDGIDKLERISSNMFINILHPDEQLAESRIYETYIQKQENQFKRISEIVGTLNSKYGEEISDLSNDFQKSKPIFSDLIESEIRLVEKVNSESLDAASLNSSIQNLHMRFIDFSASLRKISESETILSIENSNKILHKFESAKILLIIALIIALPTSILFGIFITGIIVRPLTKLEESMKAIVDGHGSITSILPETSGEAGRVTGQYNKLSIIIQASLLQISEISSRIQSSAHQLKTNAELTKLGLAGQNEEVRDIINKMKSMEENISLIDNSTANTATAAEDTYSKCQSSTKLMKETIQTVTQLDNESSETIDKMNRMASSVDSIGVVIEVINKIAAQTNLLALNAAIEAARAGESGRGFAVVADEVRNLAVQTQDSTDEINDIIEELKASAQESQNAISNNREYAAQALQKVDEISGALKDIDSSTHEIAQMTQQISDSLRQQVDAAGDINRHTINLEATTKQAESSADTMEVLGNKMENLTSRIAFAIDRFNIDRNAQEVISLTRVMGRMVGVDDDDKISSDIDPASNNTDNIEIF